MKHLLRTVALFLALALTVSACGGKAPPPPPVLGLTIVGSTTQNPDASGQGTTVAVQVYQLTATGKFQSTDVYSLISKEATVLGTDEAGASEQFLVTPGQTLTVQRPIKPEVAAIGFAVLFRQINKSTWKLVAPVAANGESDVTLQINGLTATLAK